MRVHGCVLSLQHTSSTYFTFTFHVHNITTQSLLKVDVVTAEDLSKGSEKLQCQDVDSRQSNSKEVGCVQHNTHKEMPSLGLQAERR